MKLLGPCWRKLTACKALFEAGPVENMFFRVIYRLTFIGGLSYADEGKGYEIYRAYLFGQSLLLIVLEAWYICFNNISLEETIFASSILLMHLIACWKLVTMLSNKQIYRICAKALDSPACDTSTPRRKQLVEYWSKTQNRYLTKLLCLSVSTMFCWNMFPLIDDIEYNLMTLMPIPYNYHTTCRYIITYIITGGMIDTLAYIVVMSEVIMQAYLIPLVCQYIVLADSFETILEDCGRDFRGVDISSLIDDQQFIANYKKRLGHLVEQHAIILNQTMELKRILRSPLLGQLCSSGVLICFSGYQATQNLSENPGKLLQTIGYVGYNMYTLYLICRWCEEITTQSQNIREAIYYSGWENGTYQIPGVRATILIIMSRASIPVIFDAGGMYEISLSSYGALVKASYSALNLLLQMGSD